ncbi:MAG: hypothetical protein IVW54_19255 [Candidatus Binataceae bacterium]|nr:hypothetical protein [Candidatus Binataceae bacterium]
MREILNSNEQIAMLGEVLTPSPAPAHWDNFCRKLSVRSTNPATFGEAGALLDQYFEFIKYRIRNHWEGNKKSGSHAIGVDIKYDQLRRIAPTNWSFTSPYVLFYLRAREATLIHTTRNVIHCAVSALIAKERNLWHNYGGIAIDRSYEIDVDECLRHALTIARRRDAFLESAYGCTIINCRYERLFEDIKRAGSGEVIPEGDGPLEKIAMTLGASFTFRNDRRLQKAIDIPYSRLLSNYDTLVRRVEDSEFHALAATLV